MKDKNFWRTAITNNQTYIDYNYRVRKIATSRFVWNNIPPSWDSTFLEKTLYEYGHIGVIKHSNYNTILVRAALHGFNIYNNPTSASPYAFCEDNEITKTRYVYNGGIDDIDSEKEKIVIIKNNNERIPTSHAVELFCKRLYEIERTIDVNIKQQKTPMLILCDQKQRLTLKNLYMQYDGNEPFIFGDKSLLHDNLMRTLDTKSPYLLDKLMTHKQQIWNELLTFLGINNVNFEKKERLITDEANANNTVIQINLEEELKCREIGAKHINDYFGLNVSVGINPIFSNTLKGVENNVKIHNPT